MTKDIHAETMTIAEAGERLELEPITVCNYVNDGTLLGRLADLTVTVESVQRYERQRIDEKQRRASHLRDEIGQILAADKAAGEPSDASRGYTYVPGKALRLPPDGPTERERTALKMRYDDYARLADIGAVLGASRQSVKQMIGRAVKRLYRTE